MEKKRKATKAQRERINNMLLSGLIGFDEAQEIIERRRVAPAGSRERVSSFLEEKFPGRGSELAFFLEPLFQRENWPRMRRELPDLYERCISGLDWHAYRDVHPLGVYGALSTIHIEENFEWMESSLKRVCLPFVDSDIYDELCNNFDQLFAPILEHVDSNTLRAFLEDFLIYPFALILSGRPREAGRLKSLFEILLDGNVPLGHYMDPGSRGPQLLVLVAD